MDIHACWVSPALLDTLQIPDSIAGGVILRDSDGKPTGVFLDTAYEHVMAQLPEPSLRDEVGFLEKASKNLLAQGITSVHDAATSLKAVDIYKRWMVSLNAQKRAERCPPRTDSTHGMRFPCAFMRWSLVQS